MKAFSHSLEFSLTFRLAFISCLIVYVENKSRLKGVFLNSYAFCGHDKSFVVTPDLGYTVKPDLRPDIRTTSFRDCEVTFHSAREHGRVCISQEGNIGKILDDNAQLKVYDGEGDDKPNVITVAYSPHQWTQREYCTNSPYLYLYLEKLDKAKNVDVSQIHLQYHVLDIESRDRKLYLEENYCDDTYQLEDSQVQIVNRLQYKSSDSAWKVKHVCTLTLERKPNQNRSTCFVYVPSNNFHCGKGWQLYISDEKESLSNFVYSLNCTETKARETHAWCASNNTHQLTIILSRENVKMLSNSVDEPSGMFRIFAADHAGSANSLKEEVERQMADAANRSPDNPVSLLWLLFGIPLAVIVMVLCYVCRSHYRKVPSQDDPDAGSLYT